jgi:hypothetical protein
MLGNYRVVSLVVKLEISRVVLSSIELVSIKMCNLQGDFRVQEVPSKNQKLLQGNGRSDFILCMSRKQHFDGS